MDAVPVTTSRGELGSWSACADGVRPSGRAPSFMSGPDHPNPSTGASTAARRRPVGRSCRRVETSQVTALRRAATNARATRSPGSFLLPDGRRTQLSRLPGTPGHRHESTTRATATAEIHPNRRSSQTSVGVSPRNYEWQAVTVCSRIDHHVAARTTAPAVAANEFGRFGTLTDLCNTTDYWEPSEESPREPANGAGDGRGAPAASTAPRSRASQTWITQSSTPSPSAYPARAARYRSGDRR